MTIRVFSVFCVLLLFSSPLYAQQSYHEFERELHLSGYQKVQVDAIKRKYMGEWRALNDESARKRLELREINRSRPDQWGKAERLERELDQIEASRERLFRSYRAEVSAVFTNEQKGRFNRFTEEENRRAARHIGPMVLQQSRGPYGR